MTVCKIGLEWPTQERASAKEIHWDSKFPSKLYRVGIKAAGYGGSSLTVVYHSISLGKSGSGMVKANRSRISEKNTTRSTLAIVNKEWIEDYSSSGVRIL